jgi:hypothetical protein
MICGRGYIAGETKTNLPPPEMRGACNLGIAFGFCRHRQNLIKSIEINTDFYKFGQILYKSLLIIAKSPKIRYDFVKIIENLINFEKFRQNS